jgi:hypothetical protein
MPPDDPKMDVFFENVIILVLDQLFRDNMIFSEEIAAGLG